MKKLTHSESEIVKSVNELDASQLKKLKELEEENAKLKKMYANLALDNEILREVIEKKTLEPNGTMNQPRTIPKSRLRYGRRPRLPTMASGK